MSEHVARANILDLRHSAEALAPADLVVSDKASRTWFRLPKMSLHPISLGILAGLLSVVTIGVIVPMLPAETVSPVAQAAPTITPSFAPAAAPAPSKRPAAPTDRLAINRLGTNAPVISVDLTKDGAIDTPKTLWQVAHYDKSAVVGATGTAVIVGHSGAPGQVGVFEHIDHIQVGDMITYTRADGTSISFRVTSSSAYPVNTDTARLLVASTSFASLNLISCYGNWDESSQEYDQRWIVKATLVK